MSNPSSTGRTGRGLRQKDCHQPLLGRVNELPDRTVCSVDAVTGAEIGP
jgi:hypothetical protein